MPAPTVVNIPLSTCCDLSPTHAWLHFQISLNRRNYPLKEQNQKCADLLQSYRGQLDLKCTMVKGEGKQWGEGRILLIVPLTVIWKQTWMRKKQLRQPLCWSTFSFASWMFFWCLILLMQAIWTRSSSARMPGIFSLCSGSNTALLGDSSCMARSIPLAPEGLSSYVGTIHCSYNSPLLLLSTLEANTQAILFV